MQKQDCYILEGISFGTEKQTNKTRKIFFLDRIGLDCRLKNNFWWMEDIVKAFVLISIENKRFSGAVNFGKPDSLFLFTGRNFFYFFERGTKKQQKQEDENFIWNYPEHQILSLKPEQNKNFVFYVCRKDLFEWNANGKHKSF